MDSGDTLQQMADQAREIARGWSGPDADPQWALVAALFAAIADDDALLRLVVEIPPDRLPPLLFVACVQRVVADHHDEPLAAYYPGPRQRAVDEHFAAALREFVSGHEAEVRARFDRRYQMNEVNRCVQTALALGIVQRQVAGRPLAIVDVGTGSGIGLHLDRYHVDLGAGRSFGPDDSPVRLTCDVRGTPPLPGPIDVAMRIGIDAAPIDLEDAESRAWLAACIPPTVGSLERLDAAVAVTRAAAVPILLGSGGAVLVDALAAVPDDVVPVVVDSFTAVFMDDAERAAIAAAVDERDGWWIALDPLIPLATTADRCVQGLPVDARLVAENRTRGVFGLLSIHGRRAAGVLATAHPSGTRMTWLDDEVAAGPFGAGFR